MTCTPGSEAHGITADHGGVGVRDDPLPARIELVSYR
jgi:hypothetical protein